MKLLCCGKIYTEATPYGAIRVAEWRTESRTLLVEEWRDIRPAPKIPYPAYWRPLPSPDRSR